LNMKNKTLGLGCAIVLAGGTALADEDAALAHPSGAITYVNGTATNTENILLPRLETWRVYPAEQTETAASAPAGTNALVIVDATNAPAVAPPVAAPAVAPTPAAPPVTAPANGNSDSIQSAPTLQGSEPGKGPI
jgi:hypothetical protein